MNTKKISCNIKCLLFAFCILTNLNSSAQDISKLKDLSQIKVDRLTDTDIIKFKNQLTSSGQSIQDLEKNVLERGMPKQEVAKLIDRINKLSEKDKAVGRLKSQDEREKNPEANDSIPLSQNETKPVKYLINPLIFGSELYNSLAPSFEPNQNLATPLNYILGPKDQIQLLIYGVQEYSGDLAVSSDGNISVPNVGLIKVAGLSLEAATQKIKMVLGNSAFPYLKSGGSKLSVTLSKIRSIRVTIIGANRPGNYTLSSLSTVFNALYEAGGPTEFGSFREIQLVRNSKVEKKIDLYRLLIKGDQSDNVGLQDNDIILIPAYKKRVEIQGQVKRPGIFEILPGETFRTIIDFASGFTDTAYQASVKVYQLDNRERRIKDIGKELFDSYEPTSGDLFVVSKLLNRFTNRVKISGAISRPDFYELTPNLRVRDLIQKADGLKEDAYLGRGQILRLQENLIPSMISFDIKKALSGDSLNNHYLLREDEVLISSIFDLRDSLKITIQGEIRIPGEYNYVEKLTLKDIIVQAGGFTDAAHKNIEIARIIRRDSVSFTDNRASTVINTEVSTDDLNSDATNIPLLPYDVITIRRKAGYNLPESVVVAGQVQYPGPYALISRNEKISDLLKRSGGFTPDANPEGAYLKRYKTEQEKAKADEVFKRLQKNTKASDTLANSSLQEEIRREYDQIPLDLRLILKAPGSIEDLVLRANDEIFIPKFDGQVKISGAVLLATQIPFKTRSSFKDYINEAGGYAGDAWRRKSYVVYANGRASTAKRFLFVKKYPKVLPGSEIVVPKRVDKKGVSIGEIIGVSSALASLAGLVIALLRL